MKIIILSDLHLSYIDYLIDKNFIIPERTDDILSHNLKTKFGLAGIDQIILLGDIIEMYQAILGKKRYFKKIKSKYPKTFETIENSSYIKLVNGNHDDNCLRYFENKICVDSLMIDGYLFEHGHQTDLLYGHKWSNYFSEKIAKSFYVFEYLLGSITHFKLTKFWLDYERNKRILNDVQRQYILNTFEKNDEIKGFVVGHTHLKTIEILNGKLYLNTGTYLKNEGFVLDTITGEVFLLSNLI